MSLVITAQTAHTMLRLLGTLAAQIIWLWTVRCGPEGKLCLSFGGHASLTLSFYFFIFFYCYIISSNFYITYITYIYICDIYMWYKNCMWYKTCLRWYNSKRK